MSEVAAKKKISSIRVLEYQGVSEDRAYLYNQSEPPASSLDRDGTRAKTRTGLVWC